MDNHMDKNRKWDSLEDLLKSSFGFADDQHEEQFDYYAELAKEGEPIRGNFEALAKKVEELEKSKK